MTGVTLPLTERLLADATSFTLVADVQPADATNPQITWESSDATVAEVDANGLVTAKNLGEATITARTVDGGFSATCKIKVVPMLVIATAGLTDSVDKALTDLGCTFDEVYSYSDWTSGIDFSAYDMVMVGMDGGAVSAESIQKIRTDVVDQGRRVFFIGGSAWQPFVEGVNQYLVACDTTNYF